MIDELRERLKAYQFAPLEKEQNRGRAAVLIPIDITAEPEVILTLRSSELESHAGEVALPGGRYDEEDETLLRTALRETHEEIGLPPENIEIIGELRPFISKFGLLVSPFVGLIESKVELVANPDELETIFNVPLGWLLKDPRTSTNVIERNGETHYLPEYYYDGHRIWGLTAMILKELMIHGFNVKMKQ